MTGTTIIGVTGGIATGKTHVTDTLQRAGALVLDADVISRRLTGEGGEALPRVRDAFGDSVFRPDGTLDRRALGARVFSSPEERKALEGILHPMILSEMRSRTREAEGLVFWSVPLLYECGMADECALVWCTWVPKAVQVKRVMKRDKLTRREALLRIESQMPARDKAKRADLVIRTDGPKEDTRARVLEAYRELTASKGA